MTTDAYELPINIDRYLAALSKVFELDGNRELQELIVNASSRVHERWTYDNLNGGIAAHALYLMLPEAIFLRSVSKRNEIQATICAGLNKLHHVQNEYFDEVFLEMDIVEDENWREKSGLLLTPSRTVSDAAQRRIWKDDAFRLFLSHKSEFKRETFKLKEELAHFGIDCFVAHADIHPTQAWIDEILNALTTMDGFAALMTPDFHESDWTDQEVGFAFARGVPKIAVMLGKNPYGFMGQFQGLPSTWENAALDIAGTLIKNDRMFSVYLNELRRCPCWIDANVLGSLLPSIVALDARQIDELVTVYNETTELHGAFAFDGTKPVVHGPGLVAHLNRLDRRQFRFMNDRKIEAVSAATSG